MKKTSMESRLKAVSTRIPYEHFDRTVRALLMWKGTLVDTSDRQPVRKTHAPGYQTRAERLRYALAALKPDDVDFLAHFLGNPVGFSDDATRERTRTTIKALIRGCESLATKKQPRGAVPSWDWPMIGAVALWRRYEKRKIGVAETSPFVEFARLFLEAMGLPHDGELRRRIEAAKNAKGLRLPT